MKKNINKNQFIVSVTIVAIIIALVSGATYAWWIWISADEDDTLVNVSVEGMTMILDGGGDINFGNLIPTSCNNTEYALHRTITYSVINPTQIDATGTIQLKPDIFPTQLKNEKLMWKLTTGQNCTGTEVASGNFGNTTRGTIMDLTTKVGITKEDGITYYIPAETTTPLTGIYYLSIWLDSTFEGTANVGNDVKEPIQNKSMTLKVTGTIAQNGIQ